LSLLSGEAADTGRDRQEVAFVGDLVDDVVDQVGEVFRGKRPRRR
jgi:hypothetical protein